MVDRYAIDPPWVNITVTPRCPHRWTNGRAGRQRQTETDRKADRQTDIQTDRQTAGRQR